MSLTDCFVFGSSTTYLGTKQQEKRSQEQVAIFSTIHGLFYTGVVQGIICYLDNHATCDDHSGALNQENVRECCIDRNGFAFNLLRGDEDCTECIGERSFNPGYNGVYRWHY